MCNSNIYANDWMNLDSLRFESEEDFSHPWIEDKTFKKCFKDSRAPKSSRQWIEHYCKLYNINCDTPEENFFKNEQKLRNKIHYQRSIIKDLKKKIDQVEENIKKIQKNDLRNLAGIPNQGISETYKIKNPNGMIWDLSDGDNYYVTSLIDWNTKQRLVIRSDINYRKKLINHKTSILPLKLQCPKCQEVFPTRKRKSTDEVKGFFQHIKQCIKKSVKKKSSKKIIILTHNDRKLNTCKKCNIKLNRSSDVLEHMCNQKFACEKCKKLFNTKTLLKKHQKRSKKCINL